MDRWLSHTILKEKLLLEVTLTERKAALLKQNNNEEKGILPFVTQIYYKRSFNEKVVISYKTIHQYAKFLKNHNRQRSKILTDYRQSN